MRLLHKLMTPTFMHLHRGQNSKQINITKYISKFLMYGAKMLEKCVKSQKTLWSKYLGSTNIMCDYSAILAFT